MALLETCFVTGLVVPSGVATAAATVLAGYGTIGYGEVALAAVAGGWAGDSTGYWIGRHFGRPAVSKGGRFGGVVSRTRIAAARFVGRHPVYSVTMARLVPFVRTVMPLGAGSGGLPYGRFLVWETPGVLAWAAMYMAAGFLARRSWIVATSILGVGWTAIFLLGGLVLWLAHRRRTAAQEAAPSASGEVLPPAHGMEGIPPAQGREGDTAGDGAGAC